MKEVVKVRWARTRGAVRRAAAMAERWRNIAGAIGSEVGVERGWRELEEVGVGVRRMHGTIPVTKQLCHRLWRGALS